MNQVIHTIASLASHKGGPSRSVPNLCRSLKNNGRWEVEIVVGEQGNLDDLPPDSDDLASKIHACRLGKQPALIRTLLSEHAGGTVLHDHGLWLPSNFLIAATARRQKRPLVISPRGMLEPWSLSHHSIRKRVALQSYEGCRLRWATAFHATSIEEAASIRRLKLNQPIAVIPNGVTPPEITKIRTAEPRTALFLSRITPKKGVSTLVDAWQRLRPLDWQLLIIGPDEGGHSEEIKRRIEAAHLQSSILLRPEVPDAQKWQLMSQCDLFVLPSYSENFGIVVAEALASGAPVITTTGTPWSEISEKGCGWYVEPTTDGISLALKAALSTTPDLLSQMGENGRRWMLEKFTWNSAAIAMEEFYEWILTGMPKHNRPTFLY